MEINSVINENTRKNTSFRPVKGILFHILKCANPFQNMENKQYLFHKYCLFIP